jgi:hypothetical protein
MASRWLVLLVAAPLLAGPSIVMARIDREGLPPFEGEQGKIYVLQGEGCGKLHAGTQVQLRRPGDLQPTGQLVIVRAEADHAEGKLVVPGKTYPMQGDEAIPVAEDQPPKAETPAPPPAAAPRQPAPGKAGSRKKPRPRRKPQPKPQS